MVPAFVDEKQMVADEIYCPPHLFHDSIREMLVEFDFRKGERGTFTSALDLFHEWVPFAVNFVERRGTHRESFKRIGAEKRGFELFSCFRAALGRVIRFCFLELKDGEPAYFRDLANVVKHGTLYGMISQKVRCIQLLEERTSATKQRGKEFEQKALNDPKVAAIKKYRSELRASQHLEKAEKASKTRLGWRYIDEFVGDLKCAPTLLALGVYPDGKELSESMGAFAAARSYLCSPKEGNGGPSSGLNPISMSDSSVTGLFVGDGSTPRTAAMFAFRTAWRCISVDPAMRVDNTAWGRGEVDRLKVHSKRIEDVQVNCDGPLVIIMFHAHVSVDMIMDSFRAKGGVALVTCPCCNWDRHQERFLGERPDVEYEDHGISSAKRTMRVW
eukprot:CAMPEP_0198728804 /NCGR_PEP_ID=MMETSP1475-20131203/11779_1 /TAXON_ID= ORGANISM="Unidentified sp., Strain CCMP1999" /NCGR_SAMPLE_ID=MMETSP1475 /ASSEMBLY_ACC=CAM_ASM_001111 /LENGTH=386 /DNA_ID=CAMNT_0044491273 /DNA_START=79 /DNA_END=1236 /DNA_ORIENTATION=-